jgi:gas vesicle protein
MLFKYEIAILYLMFLADCKSQSMSDQLRTSKNFIESCIDEKQLTAKLIEDYIILDKSSQPNIDFVKTQAESLRNALKGKAIDKNQLSYQTLSNNMEEFDLMLSDDQKNLVVIVKYEGKVLVPLLFKSGMINSFTTMNKGGKRIFIKY